MYAIRRYYGAGIDERVALASLERPHEACRDADRQVEIAHLRRVFLECDEVQNIRMVDAENAHIGSAPCPALLNDIRGQVEDAHEGDRPGGDAAG